MDESLCFNCFRVKSSAGACPHCGYDPAWDGQSANALPPGTILAGSYLVGRVIGRGDFGVIYIAQDRGSGRLVSIKEYFPETMVSRNAVHAVVPNAGSGEAFVYGKAAFLEEADPGRARARFEENGTAYLCMDYGEEPDPVPPFHEDGAGAGTADLRKPASVSARRQKKALPKWLAPAGIGAGAAVLVLLAAVFLLPRQTEEPAAPAEVSEIVQTPEPTEASAPEGVPQPVEGIPETKVPAAPVPSDTAASVTFDILLAEHDEYAVITGFSEAGAVLWTYTTPRFAMTELEALNPIGINYDGYYFVEGGTVRKLSLAGGEPVWSNPEFMGSASDYIFDWNGNLYLCGYYGPDLFVVDRSGATVHRTDSFNSACIWPYRLTLRGSELDIIYESNTLDESKAAVATVDADSGALSDLRLYPMASSSGVSGTLASSALSEYGVTYSAENAVDGTLELAWVEGAPGQGIGESITLFLPEECLVHGCCIYAGYQKSEALFAKNSRPASLTLRFSDGSSKDFTLDDAWGPQYIFLDEPVFSTSVTFIIGSVYPGSAYEDTVISEITLY